MNFLIVLLLLACLAENAALIFYVVVRPNRKPKVEPTPKPKRVRKPRVTKEK